MVSALRLASALELPGLGAGLMKALPGPGARFDEGAPWAGRFVCERAAGAGVLWGDDADDIEFPFGGGTPGVRFSSTAALRTAVISSASVLRLIVIFSTISPRTPPFPAPPFSLSFSPAPALLLPDPRASPRPVSAALPSPTGNYFAMGTGGPPPRSVSCRSASQYPRAELFRRSRRRRWRFPQARPGLVRPMRCT